MSWPPARRWKRAWGRRRASSVSALRNGSSRPTSIQMAAAVRDPDGRRAATEFPERGPQLAADHAVGATGASVQKDQQRTAGGPPGREQDSLLQAAPDKTAVDREMRGAVPAEARAAHE